MAGQRRKPVEPRARGGHNAAMPWSRLSLALSILALGSCTAPRAPAPVQVAERPVPSPRPPQPLASDWRDWPMTPGDWRYTQDARGSTASFGAAGAAAALTLRCDRAARSVRIVRAGAADTLTVRTSSASRALSARADGTGQATVDLPATDPLFDAMGFSRGRFVVEQANTPPLVVPAWPEVVRVAEDCRG